MSSAASQRCAIVSATAGRPWARCLHALRAEGKDPAGLTPADLAPVDEFHTRQRAATVELAGRTTWQPGLRVLDVGCGLGGSARYLAAEHGCRVTGVDLTREWIDTAEALTKLLGLEHSVSFQHADALDLPFPSDASTSQRKCAHASRPAPRQSIS